MINMNMNINQAFFSYPISYQRNGRLDIEKEKNLYLINHSSIVLLLKKKKDEPIAIGIYICPNNKLFM